MENSKTIAMIEKISIFELSIIIFFQVLFVLWLLGVW